MFVANVEDSFVEHGDGEILIESHEEVVGEGDLDSILGELVDCASIIPLDSSFLKNQENGKEKKQSKTKQGYKICDLVFWYYW